MPKYNTFKIEFSTADADWQDNPRNTLRVHLAYVALKFEQGDTHGPVIDRNGNKIGSWEYEGPEDGEE